MSRAPPQILTPTCKDFYRVVVDIGAILKGVGTILSLPITFSEKKTHTHIVT